MHRILDKDIDNSPELRQHLPSINDVYLIRQKNKAIMWFLWLSVLFVVIMFLPWTQNIRANGKVTALRPENRPQELNAFIPGRIVKWYVKEGDYVYKGDTLVQMAEVKTEYLDPNLTDQVGKQIVAKNLSAEAYRNKADAALVQMNAMREARDLKLSSIDNKIVQQRLKISSDSADLAAAENALLAYTRQIDAAQKMLDEGAMSMVEFEKRRVNYQNGKAKVNSLDNKLNQSKQELLNLKINRNEVVQDYSEKLAKTDGERYASISSATSTEADIAKLENQLSNYAVRRDFLYLLAPQSGQVTKAKKAGIGEIIKEGDMIIEIVPEINEKAVELYIKPMDLPLISVGQDIRFIFDGFPAIVFSGWPNSSYGTFGGQVAAIESNTDANGLFKILVVPDPEEGEWPEMLKIGGGARGIALLKDVPVYYELWRNINGFPPEYYQFKPDETKAKK
ncbi:HlyD family secretion protein [Jiulongibacter sediminis]|jgi:multidrug efflux pump subunit AcrA (membrane-fusion protein)|uniref:HlyD family secretion protein n=1 Tax=Jiulongibacter sediminis TaxID=1605367 RepID=UPI0026EDDEE6|nr:HlyD family efflux transporter periplasmic adaptor subunit [Jiulongibacter sediminis]